MSSKLLIHEDPLQVLPSLAVAIGLNEAIILQQIHYWMQKSERRMESKTWIYNTYDQWHKQFPFWGYNTIRRTMDRLKDLGIVEATTRFNRSPIDKTWWYTINYTRLDDFDVPRNVPPTAQDGLSTAQDGLSTAQDGLSTAQDGLTPREVPPRELLTEILRPPVIPQQKKVRKGKGLDYSPGYLAFWDIYPHQRRISKPACYKVWQQQALEDRTAEIVEKVERLKITSWLGKDPTFIPQTITWLNQGRYEDDLMEIPEPPIGHGQLSEKEQRTAEATMRVMEKEYANAHAPRGDAGVLRQIE